jgi:hypothetical protein
MKYDEYFLLMRYAKNQGSLIVWAFAPVTIGMAQAIVTTVVPPLIGTFVQTHHIEVIGHDVAALPTILDGNGGDLSIP